MSNNYRSMADPEPLRLDETVFIHTRHRYTKIKNNKSFIMGELKRIKASGVLDTHSVSAYWLKRIANSYEDQEQQKRLWYGAKLGTLALCEHFGTTRVPMLSDATAARYRLRTLQDPNFDSTNLQAQRLMERGVATHNISPNEDLILQLHDFYASIDTQRQLVAPYSTEATTGAGIVIFLAGVAFNSPPQPQ